MESVRMRTIAIGGVALLLAACGNSGTSTSSGGATSDLLGAGATFPDPVYQEWIGEFVSSQNSGTSITYEPIGSGGGVEQFTAKATDFGGSDAYMTDEELAAAEQAWGCDVVHIPTVFGAITLAFNVDGLDSLTLDHDTIARIYLGQITKWNDPAIAALNAGASLPDEPIIVAHRSDASGTTNGFTTYLDHDSASWHAQVGAGKEVSWPVGVGGEGNDGVAAAIKQNDGGLGYVELSYALENDLPVASVINADGKAVQPTLASTAAAAQAITIPDDLRFTILDVGGDGYPIATATWILAATCGLDPAKADALKAFLRWALENGDDIAESLQYAPIGKDLQAKSLANVERINAGG